MNRINIEQIPSDEAKLALDGAEPMSIANAIAVASTENASSSPSTSSSPNCSLPLECHEKSENILNSIKVNEHSTQRNMSALTLISSALFQFSQIPANDC